MAEGKLARIAAFLEERTGYRALVSAALDEPVPGGARARYVFGSVLLFLIGNQVITGTLLAAGYAPSTHDAWASVAYIEEVAPLGWFIRGMHSTGASAAIVVVLLHLIQVTWAGAYRRPREVTWWVGLALLGLLLTFGLTGYLLPWDQKGYFATQVATSLIGATPVVGPSVQTIVQGGAHYGNLTLTRFYALHVLVLPMLVAAAIGVHVVLFRRHGVTPPAALDQSTLAVRTQPFYPRQVALDLVAATACAAVIVALVLRTHGAGLEAPADPSSSYEARPEWYFLPLFQLLRHLPGSLELVGAIGVPLVAIGLLAALPFFDRGPSRAPMNRKLPLAIVGLIVAGAVALGVSAKIEDASDTAFARGRARSDADAEAARVRFRARVGGGPLTPADQRVLGNALFEEHCAGCHRLGGRGEAHAPELDGWSSRAWIDAFLAAPDDPRFFGHTEIHGMKPVLVEGEDRKALVEWLWSLGGAAGADAALVTRGEALFESLSCSDCHARDGTSDGAGVPNLGGRASAGWIVGLLSDAGGPLYFGKKNTMPPFKDKLTPVEMDALVALLRSAR